MHVDQLRAELDVLKLTVDEMNDGSFDQFADGTVGAGYGGGRKARKPAQPLPLVIGALGQLHDVNAKLFDDRQASQPGYQFDGSKGGVAWKGKLENYFISKCPGMMEILSWSEKWEGRRSTALSSTRPWPGPPWTTSAWIT